MNNSSLCILCFQQSNITNTDLPVCQSCLNQQAQNLEKFEDEIDKIHQEDQIKQDDSSSISEILPNKLYLGNYIAAKNKNLMKKYQITHILICGDFLKQKFPEDFKYHQIMIQDSLNQSILEYLDETFKFIDQPGNVFVHCAAGINRSPAIVCAYLMKKNKWNYDTAFEFKEDLLLTNKQILQNNQIYMNIDQGIKQFNGDERQYKTSLITFDSLTLSINHQYQSQINLLRTKIYQSTQIVKLTGFEITVSQFMQFFERVNKQEPNYDYQLHNQLRSYFLKVKETRELISQYTGVQLDYTYIDHILQQMLLGQNLNNTLSQPKSDRTNENATNLQDDKDQQEYLSIQNNGLSQPRKPNEDCCFIY